MVALCAMAHIRDEETVANMVHLAFDSGKENTRYPKSY